MKRGDWGTVRQLPSGRWQARYSDAAGRRISAPQTFKEKRAARAWLAATRTDQARGQWVDPRKGTQTVEEWSRYWLDTATDLRRSTLDGYRVQLDKHVLPTFGGMPLASVQPQDVRSWLAALARKGLASSSQRKAYSVLHRLLEVAVELETLPRNPAAKVTPPKEQQREMRFLEPGEVFNLREAMHPRYRALALLGCYGGLRWGELAGLKRNRLDLARGTVEVVEQVQELNDGTLLWGEPKTAAGRRVVPLPAFLVTALREHVDEYVEDSPEALVFTSAEGAVLRDGKFRRRYWVPACKAAGLAALRIHDMRHTAVALAIAAGGHPKELQRRFGHSSITVTMDRYGHLIEGAGERVAAGLDAIAEAAQAVAVRDVSALSLG